MELKSLRKADFVSSILFIFFGLFVTYMAFQMPMEASYGGVQTHWYVAPALFPLCIGAALIIMSVLLLYVSIRDGGLSTLIGEIKNRTGQKIDDKNIRVWIIFLSLSSFIYVFIPYIDFVVSIATFLFFICSVFYSKSLSVFRNITLFFIAETFVFIVLFSLGIGKYLIGIYPYTMDVLALLFLIAMNIYARKLMKKDGLPAKKINTVMWLSIITPMILCPVFRYPLLTPLPNEGIILDHMNWIYYSIKY